MTVRSAYRSCISLHPSNPVYDYSVKGLASIAPFGAPPVGEPSTTTIATTLEDSLSLVSQNGLSKLSRKVSTTIPDPPDGYTALLAASNPVLVETERTIDQLAAAVLRNVRAVWQARVDIQRR